MTPTDIGITPFDLDLPELRNGAESWRMFNPSIIADGEGFIIAFRLVGPSGRRDIAIARLDTAFRVRPGSTRCLSSRLELPPGTETGWFADPRLYRFEGRLHLYWNSGWQEPVNHQFLVELNEKSFLPRARARSLHLLTPERAIEKNWTFFGDRLEYAVYEPQPHRIVRLVEEAGGHLGFEEAYRQDWDDTCFTRRYGSLRGGAPPVPGGGHYTSFCHCVVPTALGYRYFAAAYRFSSVPPFEMLSRPRTVLGLARTTGRGLAEASFNPATEQVVYPAGAVQQGGDWLIAYGLNDAEARIARIPSHLVDSTQIPFHASGQTP